MKWPDLIADLLRVKDADGRPVWNCGSIAKHCGCTRSRIGQLRQPGTEPSWSVGQRLITLHERQMQAATAVTKWGAEMKPGHVRLITGIDVATGKAFRRLDYILPVNDAQVTISVQSGDGQIERAMNIVRTGLRDNGIEFHRVLAPAAVPTFATEFLPL